MSLIALDSVAQCGTVVQPHRRDYMPKPLCPVDPNALAVAARTIAQSVAAIHRSRNASSYLYVGVGLHNPTDPSIYAYLVSEERSVAQLWVVSKFKWLLGLYAPHVTPTGRNPADARARLSTSVTELVDDLAWHLKDLGLAR